MRRSKLEAIRARALDSGATLEEQRTCALLYLQKAQGEVDDSDCKACAFKDEAILILQRENAELRALIDLMDQELVKNRVELSIARAANELAKGLRKPRF